MWNFRSTICTLSAHIFCSLEVLWKFFLKTIDKISVLRAACDPLSITIDTSTPTLPFFLVVNLKAISWRFQWKCFVAFDWSFWKGLHGREKCIQKHHLRYSVMNLVDTQKENSWTSRGESILEELKMVTKLKNCHFTLAEVDSRIAFVPSTCLFSNPSDYSNIRYPRILCFGTWTFIMSTRTISTPITNCLYFWLQIKVNVIFLLCSWRYDYLIFDGHLSHMALLQLGLGQDYRTAAFNFCFKVQDSRQNPDKIFTCCGQSLPKTMAS